MKVGLVGLVVKVGLVVGLEEREERVVEMVVVEGLGKAEMEKVVKVVMAAEKVAVVGWEVAMGAEVAAAGEAGSGLVEEMGAEDSEMVDLVVG